MSKKYITKDVEINGLPFKQISSLTSVMFKPDSTIIPPSIHVSGLHAIFENPRNTHFDHYHNGSEWKEYPGEIVGNRICQEFRAVGLTAGIIIVHQNISDTEI